MKQFMQIAIEEALTGIQQKDGGPFGAVVVLDGKVIGRGHNRVLSKHDPTCHGEMEAIRDACKHLGSHDLSACTLYTTAEPCPMCLGAIMWANIQKVYYGCNVKDTDAIGFRDDRFYAHLNGTASVLSLEELERQACLRVFDTYKKDESNQRY